MSKLVNVTSLTVDGLVDVSEWFVPGGAHSDVQLDWVRQAAAMVMGRKTYEGLAGYWPAETGDWADRLNEMPKYVASRTLEEPLEWNSSLLEGDLALSVPKLKDETDGELMLVGCGELARDLIRLGLVDELAFWVHPAVWGPGTRPYEGEAVRLELLGAEAYDSGVVHLRYRPSVATP